MPRKSKNTSYSSKEVEEEGSLRVSRLDEARNTIKNHTAFRVILLHKANELYFSGKHQESIKYQVETLCLGFRTKFFGYSTLSSDFHSNLLADLRSQKNRNPSFVPTLAWDLVKSKTEFLPTEKKENVEICQNLDAKSLIERCRELPEEWIVLHLCKDFNPTSISLFQSDIITYNAGIFLTLLKYPRSDLNNNEPVCIYLPPVDQENVYEFIQEIAKEQSSIMKVPDKTDSEFRAVYWEKIAKLDQKYSILIQKMEKWLGPWVVLFQGRIKPTSVDHEKRVFDHVDDFAKREKLSGRQIVLLSIICCGIDILDDDDIIRASQEIAKSDSQFAEIKNFLHEFEYSSTIDKSVKRSPTILIVDELLDQFPWELLVADREITRVSSLHILMRLFDKYKNQIRKGYLHLNLEQGNALLNTNGDLMKMEKRIVAFLNYWLPHWQQHVRKVPTREEMNNLLESADIFVYSGHGSAMKFMKAEELLKSSFNCVVMLFGCDSVKLKSNGFCSEMIGSHLYYHYALCPLVIGATNIITDLPIDELSTRVLSTWFKPPDSKLKHFAYYDPKAFKDGNVVMKSRCPPAWKQLHNPNILEIFGDIRSSGTKTAVWLKASIILRGLPIWSITE